MKASKAQYRENGAGKGDLAAIITLGTAGVTSFLAMPVIAVALVNSLGQTERDVSLFSTIQLVTLSLGCIVSTFLPRGRVRSCGLAGLVIMLLCDGLCLLGPDWPVFLVLRALSGAAGGVAVSQATAAMGRTANPERSFGLFLALQTVMSVICVYGLPAIIAGHGFYAAYSGLIAFELVALVLVLLLVRDKAHRQVMQEAEGNDAARWLRCGAILTSILSLFIGVGVLWTFLALLGQEISLTEAQIALILSISKLVAFAASFVPGMIGERYGRLGPILVCVAVLTAAVQIFSLSTGFGGFVVATALFSLGWYMIYPFQLAALGEVDCDGRPMLAAAALTGAGLGIGPALTIFAPEGAAGIYLVATLAFLAAGLMAVAALANARMPAPATARGLS
jgi:MFS family permease